VKSESLAVRGQVGQVGHGSTLGSVPYKKMSKIDEESQK
jgi:hypothetical protein